MKIVLVAPSPVPFTFGGTESMIVEIQRLFNTQTSHQCEVMKIPTRENSFWQLIDSYYAFHTLDLSHFDVVISTKYPSWMIRHPVHFLYLIHPFRQVYDLYPNFSHQYEVYGFDQYDRVQEILKIIQTGDERNNDVFDLLFSIRNDISSYPNELFHFPGPFLRNIIHYFDRNACSPARIKKYFAISKRVREREGYFPDNVPVKVLYPPSSQISCPEKTQTGNYALSVSRLANTKRIDLLIEAMSYVSPEIHLKIVGEGPEEKKLRKIAKNNPQIEFIGFVTDQQLKDLYSNAFTLLFVPRDEEYGLVIPEAMQCKKPVITANDSGGPLELVKDGENGFIVNPDPREIAEKIEYLYQNPQHAQLMGNDGSEFIQKLNKRFIQVLSSELEDFNSLKTKKSRFKSFFRDGNFF